MDECGGVRRTRPEHCFERRKLLVSRNNLPTQDLAGAIGDPEIIHHLVGVLVSQRGTPINCSHHSALNIRRDPDSMHAWGRHPTLELTRNDVSYRAPSKRVLADKRFVREDSDRVEIALLVCVRALPDFRRDITRCSSRPNALAHVPAHTHVDNLDDLTST